VLLSNINDINDGSVKEKDNDDGWTTVHHHKQKTCKDGTKYILGTGKMRSTEIAHSGLNSTVTGYSVCMVCILEQCTRGDEKQDARHCCAVSYVSGVDCGDAVCTGNGVCPKNHRIYRATD
jgi:hypothetical protein